MKTTTLSTSAVILPLLNPVYWRSLDGFLNIVLYIKDNTSSLPERWYRRKINRKEFQTTGDILSSAGSSTLRFFFHADLKNVILVMIVCEKESFSWKWFEVKAPFFVGPSER